MSSAACLPPRDTPWLVRSGRRSHAPTVLVCFSHAGGGASGYARWEEGLPDEVEVLAVQLPGREGRIRERPIADMELIVCSIAEGISKLGARRIVLFGHSLGALLAYEVAHRMWREAGSGPAALIVSAAAAPEAMVQLNDYRGMSDEQLIAELSHRYGGIPDAILKDDDILQLYIGILRADLQLLGDFRYVERIPLGCPITALCGASDRIATASRMQAWARYTGAGFSLTTLDGGHFFLHEQRRQTLQVITAVTRGRAPLVSEEGAGDAAR